MDKFEEAWKENRHVWESSKNLAKAMYLAGQQSRQAEVDQLKHEKSLQEIAINQVAQANQEWQKHIDEKEKHAHNLYYENANLQTLVEEKDKRIEEVLFVIARAKDGYYGYSNDGGDTDNLVSDLEKALGDNNANS